MAVSPYRRAGVQQQPGTSHAAARRSIVSLAVLMRFEISPDHAAVAQRDIFFRDQRMIEGIGLEKLAGIL